VPCRQGSSSGTSSSVGGSSSSSSLSGAGSAGAPAKSAHAATPTLPNQSHDVPSVEAARNLAPVALNTPASAPRGGVSAARIAGLTNVQLGSGGSASTASLAVITSTGAWIKPVTGGAWQQIAPASDTPQDVSVGGGYLSVITNGGTWIRPIAGGAWVGVTAASDKPQDISLGGSYVGVITGTGGWIKPIAGGAWQGEVGTDQSKDFAVGD